MLKEEKKNYPKTAFEPRNKETQRWCQSAFQQLGPERSLTCEVVPVLLWDQVV